MLPMKSSAAADRPNLFIIFLKVRLYALTLYQATDCAAVTDISGVTVCCQLSR